MDMSKEEVDEALLNAGIEYKENKEEEMYELLYEFNHCIIAFDDDKVVEITVDFENMKEKSDFLVFGIDGNENIKSVFKKMKQYNPLQDENGKYKRISFLAREYIGVNYNFNDNGELLFMYVFVDTSNGANRIGSTD